MAAYVRLQFSVSATTRAARPGEVDGKSYYFVTQQQFEQMIAEDAFVEYDCHMSNYYGTPTAQLEEKLGMEKNTVNIINKDKRYVKVVSMESPPDINQYIYVRPQSTAKTIRM